jgi:thioredoxin-like negative regulator of GroEL
MAVPTMILFKDGKPINKLVGFAPKQQILKLIKNAL